jgi:hypothetical protein
VQFVIVKEVDLAMRQQTVKLLHLHSFLKNIVLLMECYVVGYEAMLAVNIKI